MAQGICSVVEDGKRCDKPTGVPGTARGMCGKHYVRWKKYGDPLFVHRLLGHDEERFWQFVDRRGDDECWPWTGTTTGRGPDDQYARFTVAGRQVGAHRWAYEHFVGPIPDGYTIDHVKAKGCTRTDCVNFLRHLEPVTQRENTLRSNNVGARNARVTHCPKNHEYTPDNTYVNRRGGRDCKKCAIRRAREAEERKRAQRLDAAERTTFY